MHIVWSLLGENQWWALILTVAPIAWIAWEVAFYFMFGPDWERAVDEPPVALGGLIMTVGTLSVVFGLLALVDVIVYLWTTPS